ncbi:cytochrome c biogenesis protein ResB [Leucobacter chromiiresistens]|uniref:Cytochrome c biogenesis protein n=1 Tax=Leucobacter chromiiresistens TaxID=1079994 RepID=A0A1H0YH78_9MICO|nr:cytochrome c biogenesis protein ResB [Leucobacter chromiiresistens]SDQ14448.1 cytochrome c biogenesis protein [Leucobacter chromiiresistens]
MSNSRSDNDTLPARPSDHVDSTERGGGEVGLGWRGWLRWAWRQLTSMRTALILLLLMAIAAIPGSLFPQRQADPNGVVKYFDDNPELAPTIDTLQLFDVYSSAWFSAIYLLLFVSLIGCIIPRIKHHAKALRAPAPKTPARLQRMVGYSSSELQIVAGRTSEADVAHAVAIAESELRHRGYRTARYDTPSSWSVSAERGYLRETGNLVFHSALVGILVTVLLSTGLNYTGDRVIVQGTTFVNSESAYSSFSPGRNFDRSSLTPYALSLDGFDVEYVDPGLPGAGQAGNFAAHLSIREPGDDDSRAETVRVNSPIEVNGDRIYLLGNGYAPMITIRNAAGDVVYQEPQPFLPQDSAMTSLGVIKVPDGLPEQVGLIGFLYPTQSTLDTGAYYSVFPDLYNPMMTFNVFTGDLGIDDGTPRSVYQLDTESMTQITGGDTGVDSIELTPGDTADLPNGMGTITFEDLTVTEGAEEPIKRFVSLQIQRDTGATWVLIFSILATVGLITGLLIPRRRLWVKATLTDPVVGERKVKIEYAGLARGEDPALERSIEQFRTSHLSAIAEQLPSPHFKKGTP